MSDEGPELLGMELAPALDRLIATLQRYDVTTQYLVSGFLAVWHAAHFGTPEWSETVVAGIEKHSRQILAGHTEFSRRGGEAAARDDGTLDGDQRLLALLRAIPGGYA